MFIVKLNYIPRGKFAKATAKATLGYNTTRLGKDKTEITRTLFSHGGELTEEQSLKIIDTAPKGTYFWRVILSPDPNGEDKQKDLDMWGLTKQVVESVEIFLKMEGKIDFIAAEHNDHTDKRHIHAIMLLPRLSKEQFHALAYVPRDAATNLALSQQKDRERFAYAFSLLQGQQLVQHQFTTGATEYSQRLVGVAGGKAEKVSWKPLKIQFCPECKAMNDKYDAKCLNCGTALQRSVGRSL